MHIWLVLGLLCCGAFSTVQGIAWPFSSRNSADKVPPAATEPDQQYTADRQSHQQPRARLAHSGVIAVVFHQVSLGPLHFHI